MKIINLTEIQFDEYSKTHILHTYYQTSAYGNTMINQGYKVEYLGFMEQEQMVGASLVLSKKFLLNYDYIYIPRGYLIDYTNIELLKKATEAMKKMYQHRSVFIKIDPPVIDFIHDKTGKVIAQAKVLAGKNLVSLGYKYFGPNLYFETLKPRWNAIINTKNKLTHDDYEKQIRNKINKAETRKIEIKQLEPQQLDKFYKFVAKKHYRNINYYANMQKFFKDKFEMYTAIINTNEYLKVIQKLHEQAGFKNDELNNKMQSGKVKGADMRKTISTKMESDKLVNVYENELKNATQLLAKYPDGLEIGAIAIIKSGTKIQLLIDGFNPQFKNLYPTFLLKDYIINKYQNEGYKIFDFNAITGNFTDQNKYAGLNEMKLGFNFSITEYIGEFDLVLNEPIYRLYSRLGGENYLKRKTK